MNKRLFLAIPLSTEIQEELGQYKDQLNLQNIRWTQLQNLHITLYFLGDVEEKTIPSLIENLNANFLEVKPFTLKFEKITFAPPNKNPRMIWGQFKNNSAYESLYKITQKAVANFVTNDIKQNGERNPIPHVTMARFNFLKNAHDIKLQQPELPDLIVESCILMESQLNRNGPTYTNVSTFIFK